MVEAASLTAETSTTNQHHGLAPSIHYETRMRFVIPFLLCLPFLELWLLIHIGSEIGALTTIALLILAGMAGSALLRWQGVYTLLKVQERLQRGDVAADAVFDGLLLTVAGVLLFIPGFITDGMALLLMIPPLRAYLTRKLLQPYFIQSGFVTSGNFTRGDTIDGEWRREDDPRLP